MQRRTLFTTSSAIAVAVTALVVAGIGLPRTGGAQTSVAGNTLSTLSTLGAPGTAVATVAPTPPVHAAQSIPNAIYGGSARMRFLGFDVYDAALWVAPGFQANAYGQSPLILELGYLRNLNSRSIAQRSISEMRRAGSFSPAQELRWQAAMETSFADVKVGDRITGVHNPMSGARFWFNGLARPPIEDPEFSRLFFGIWLASSTSEPKLRTALLAYLPQ